MKYQVKTQLDKSDALTSILKYRGIEDIDSYLNSNSSDELSPFDLDNMQEGIDLFLKHIKNKSTVFIQVDSDFDGYASAAIIYHYIKMCDPSIEVLWDVHDGKHHGIVVNKIPETTNLVIAPDSASGNFEEHKELKEMGIDVLVLDHHECDRYSEDAVVINNQLSQNYSNKYLSGGGVTYKFCQGVDLALSVNYSKNLIDLCATSIISDMMDLRNNEIRHYLNLGLNNINNIGLKKLIEVQSFSISNSESPVPKDIAWYIAPLVNALIRVGTTEEKKILFEAFIDGDRIVASTKRGAKGETENIATQASRICVNAKSRQERKVTDALSQLEFKIEKDDLNSHAVIFIPIEDEQIDTSLTGLIAMKICAKYKKPIIIARKNDDGFWRGSARGLSTIGIEGLKDFFDNSGLFEYTAG